MSNYKLFCWDYLGVLKTFPDRIFHTVVTSPPYWGLRDYGTAEWEGGDAACDHYKPNRAGVNAQAGNTLQGVGDYYRDTCGKCGATRKDQQLGLERTPEEYVEKLVTIFREVRRTLRDEGTLWLNLGDSYSGSPMGNRDDRDNVKQGTNTGSLIRSKPNGRIPGLKPKDLVGIPWRVAFALQADGWYLRSDIIWHKPNPMPESVRDRPTKSHEYLFLLTKQERYFYDADAVREPHATYVERDGQMVHTTGGNRRKRAGTWAYEDSGVAGAHPAGRNRRSVWTIATRGYKEAHFATFTPGLVEPCILAGTSEYGACSICGAPWKRVVERDVPATGRRDFPSTLAKLGTPSQGGYLKPRAVKTLGWEPTCVCSGSFVRETYQDGTFQDEEGKEHPVMKTRRTYVPCIPLEDHPVKSCLVLDPFAGASTTGAVALQHRRRFVGIELNPDYITLSERRLEEVEDSQAETQESQESA